MNRVLILSWLILLSACSNYNKLRFKKVEKHKEFVVHPLKKDKDRISETEQMLRFEKLESQIDVSMVDTLVEVPEKSPMMQQHSNNSMNKQQNVFYSMLVQKNENKTEKMQQIIYDKNSKIDGEDKEPKRGWLIFGGVILIIVGLIVAMVLFAIMAIQLGSLLWGIPGLIVGGFIITTGVFLMLDNERYRTRKLAGWFLVVFSILIALLAIALAVSNPTAYSLLLLIPALLVFVGGISLT